MKTDFLRPIDLHGKTVKAQVLNMKPDLWGTEVFVMTEELGTLATNMHRYQCDGVSVGDDIEVVIYCSNLLMPALFSIKR